MQLEPGSLLYRLKRWILFIILMFIALPCYSQVIIVNTSSSLNAISQSQLRSIFSMRVRTWPDDKPIKVFIFSPDSQIHKSFCFKVLEVFPYQLQHIWDVMLFSGTGSIPIEVESEAAMLKLVASTPGAIGYIESLKEGESNVKILQLQ